MSDKKDIEARRWCFTWNNYPYDWQDYIAKMNATYWICGKEIAPTTGTPHLQGYAEFKGSKRFSTLQKIHKSIQLIKCNGNSDQNYAYCSKDGNFEEFGERTKQGKRNDIDAAKELIENGGTLLDLAEDNFGTFLKYNKGLMMYKSLLDKKKAISRGFKPRTVKVYWGTAGAGKTRAAFADIAARGEEGNMFIVTPGVSGMWWSGYDGENNVILDDFKGHCPLAILLRICDGYPVQVQIHGGLVQMIAENVYITSNFPWWDWYGMDERHPQFRALERRLTQVFHFDKEFDPSNPGDYI
ncbi:replication-associated protein [Crucivirus-411]|nr:replication-associated protein [Crucivirus-411]